MKLGDQHTLFPYSAIVDRPPLKWPNDAQIAVWVVPNIEHYELEVQGRQADVRTLSLRDYGNRVGIWRLMNALIEFGCVARSRSTQPSAASIRALSNVPWSSIGR